MRNCCSDTLYNKLSYDTRDIVRSSRFKEVFPDVKLRGDKQNVHGWSLEAARQVSYFGAGVGGTVIGFGASMLAMTDDLYKSLEDALSDTNNEKVWSWKQGTHDSRIEGNCCSIDIGTRWSATDVLGRMEEMGKYDEIIRIAALDENDRSSCEDVHTTEYYHELREETDDSIRNWARRLVLDKSSGTSRERRACLCAGFFCGASRFVSCLGRAAWPSGRWGAFTAPWARWGRFSGASGRFLWEAACLGARFSGLGALLGRSAPLCSRVRRGCSRFSCFVSIGFLLG